MQIVDVMRDEKTQFHMMFEECLMLKDVLKTLIQIHNERTKTVVSTLRETK